MHTEIVEIRSTWQATPRLIRSLVIIFPIFGLLLAGCGYRLDVVGWWDSRSFLLNLTTATVGFSIGAPLALIAFASISNSQKRNAEIEMVTSLTARVWEQFVDDYRRSYMIQARPYELSAFVNTTAAKISQLRLEVENFYHDSVLNGVQGSTCSGPIGADGGPGGISFDELAIHVKEMHASVLTEVGDRGWYSFGTEGRADEWYVLCSQWRFIEGHLRSRRLELNLTWFTYNIDGYFRWVFRDDANPVARVYEALRETRSSEEWKFIRELNIFVNMVTGSEISFVQKYSSHRESKDFGATYFQKAMYHAQDAVNILSGIDQTIGAIDARSLVAVIPGSLTVK